MREGLPNEEGQSPLLAGRKELKIASGSQGKDSRTRGGYGAEEDEVACQGGISTGT